VHPDLAQKLVPLHPELGILLLQNAQLAQQGVHVPSGGGQHFIGQHRLQLRALPVVLGA